MLKVSHIIFLILFSSLIVTDGVFAQTEEDAEAMFNQAKEHFIKGEYKESITIYDEILEIIPNNISTLKMKGIALTNLEEHEKSLKQFFKVLQYKPKDVISLTGIGVGFGNLGEYQESITYFEKASKEKPNSVVINNYKIFINNVISKYPYTPTEKPKDFEVAHTTVIPEWVKPIASWWSEDVIEDNEFNSALVYMIENQIIQVPPVELENQPDEEIPEWVKNNAGWWADGQIDDDSFVTSIQHLIENGLIVVNTEKDSQIDTQKSQEELDHEFYLFERYLRDIANNIDKEKRYIEFPNPSKDVIKKFLRDYVKWNFEEEVKRASGKFPDPTYQLDDDGVYIINYKVFINDQPTGLPLNHVSTLENSFAFWGKQELTTNDQKTRMTFEVTNTKQDANVWVTWVVRNIGDGVLGHAHIGKGVVEVTLGDYNCDGSFQLYDVKSVETIMTHELGHSIGLKHVDNQENIMYPSFNPSYAYCLLN